MSDPPGNVKNAFSSFEVQTVMSQAKRGDVVYAEISSSPALLDWNWGLNSNYKGYSVKDDLVELMTTDNWSILTDSFLAEDMELSTKTEFLADSRLSLECRTGTPYAVSFQVNSQGGKAI